MEVVSLSLCMDIKTTHWQMPVVHTGRLQAGVITKEATAVTTTVDVYAADVYAAGIIR